MERIRLVLVSLALLLLSAGVASGQVDLTITKTAVSEPFVRGQTGAYSIVVTNGNAGAPTSAGITVFDTLPAGLTYNSGSGSSWSCDGSSGQNVNCNFSTLGLTGQAPTLTLTVNVGLGAPSSVVNTATVSGGGEVPPQDGNNSDSETTSVVSPVDITTTSLPDATVGVAYNQSLAATGGQTPYTWDVSAGSLAPLTLNSNGTITGTPTTATTLNFTARVTDNLGGIDTQALSITVDPAPNPVPTTSSIEPNQANAGDPGFTLTVNGSNFISDSVVRWDGDPLSTTFISANQLTAAVSSSRISSAGSVDVTVLNPSPGGGTSNAQTFTINQTLNITTTSLPNGTLGVAYSQTLTAEGGVLAYLWSLAPGSGPLPNGLTLGLLSGTIAGTPSAAGTFNFTVRVTDALLRTDDQPLSITINNPTPIISSLSPSARTAGLGTFTLTVNGSSFVNGAVVRWDGNSLSTQFVNSTQLTANVPAARTNTPGTFDVTVTNPPPPDGGVTSAPATFTVNPPVDITTTSLPAGIFGVQYSQTLTATGGTGAITWSVSSGSLPPGLTLSGSTGQISGTPTSVGEFDFTVTATDSQSASDSQPLRININNPLPAILGLSPASAVAGGPAFTLTVNGPGNSNSFVQSSVVRWNGENLTTTFVSATQLTASVSADRIALAGSASVSVFTPEPGGGTSNAVSFTITNPTDLSITNVIPGSAIAGSGTLQVAVRGTNFVPNSAVRWNGQAVPATFISPTEITATIDASLLATAGTAGITVVNPPPGGGTSNVFTFIINNPLPVLSSISPDGKSAGQDAFTLTLTGSNFISSSQVSWNGMALTSTFVSSTELRATVPANLIANPGTASVTVENPEPGGGISAARTFTIGDQLTITTETPLPSGTIGLPYSRTINAVGGDPPYRWGLATGSQVPPGLALNPNSGVLSGTPTEIGTYSVNIQVTDSLNVMASKAFVLTISPATFLITTDSPLPNAQLGAAYTQTFAASGGTQPYVQWNVTGGQLPNGLTLNTANGTLSGTPSAAGNFTFTITVTDNAAETASKEFTLTVPPPGNVLTILTTSCPAASVGAAYNCSFTASGGTPAYTWAITAGTLPTGLALNNTSGVISGTPQSVGEANLTMRVTDAVTATDTQTFTINVTAATVTISLLGTAGPAQQNQVMLTLPQARSSAVTGEVALSFTPDPALPNGGAGLDDPAIQFSGNRQRTASFTVPAGSTEATFTGGNLMLQTGTIAGTVTVTLTSMRSGGSVITPSPAPTQSVVVARLAPVISSVRIVNRTAAGFSIEVTGYATPRDLTQAGFQFTGQNLQGAQATIQLGTAAQTWYASEASLAFGSLFTYTQPFTTSADPAGITSVSVTLTNSLGNSAAASANF